MKKIAVKPVILASVFAALFLILFTVSAEATISGITGPTFNLTAKADHISTADGGSVLLWGYADGNARAQYPGPTLILDQGIPVTINLTNNLTVAGPGLAPNVSMVFPGHIVDTSLSDAGALTGLLTKEAPPNGTTTVRYTFTPTHAGTYMYHSGTNPALQVEMGLTGAIIVRPKDAGVDHAYNHGDTRFDREYLFFLSEMDPRIHEAVEFFGPDAPEIQAYLDNYFPNYWFINGRTAVDTLMAGNSLLLPTQPYNIVPRMHPNEKMLMRVVGAGRDRHPFHHHGSHSRIIARDGRLLESAEGIGPDLSTEVFTITSVPGETIDSIFEWTGKGLGWDIYGTLEAGAEFDHTCNDIPVDADNPGSDGFDPDTQEYCPDHGKPLPVALPNPLDLTFGGLWSGSPFLGQAGTLPPGEGGLNPNSAFTYMWHTHTEREMTNYDIFPGGMMTMMFIEAPDVVIP